MLGATIPNNNQNNIIFDSSERSVRGGNLKGCSSSRHRYDSREEEDEDDE